MMQRLITSTRCKRALFGAAALTCFGAAFVLAPSDVRSQLDAGRHEALVEPVPRAAAPVTAIAPHGDPFAPRADIGDDRPPEVEPSLSVAVTGRAANPLPQRAAAPATHVTAIAIGALPTAIVEGGGISRVVTAGDRLDESQITAIDRTSITLANGRRLSLEPPAPAP